MRIEYVYAASPAIEQKLIEKHGVELPEAAEALSNDPYVRVLGRDQYGQMRYGALGQTDSGRQLAVVFVRELPNAAKVITARSMSAKESRAYRRQRRRK